MYIMALFGVIAYKKKIFTGSSIAQLSTLSIYMINPMILLMLFQIPYEEEKLDNLLAGIGISFVVIVAGFILSHLFLKKDQSIEKFAVGFTNSTFIGIPLVSSIMGAENTYLLSAYVIWFNIFNFSYGVYMISRNWKNVSLKKVLKTPGFVAPIIGFALYVLQIRFPKPLADAFSGIASMNTPLAMLVFGIYLARTDFLQLARDRSMAYVSMIKLIIVPLISLIILKLLPGPGVVKMVVLIATACPGAMALPMMAAIYGADDILGARLVTHSTTMAFLTMPFIIYLGKIWLL